MGRQMGRQNKSLLVRYTQFFGKYAINASMIHTCPVATLVPHRIDMLSPTLDG
jgi:hypothetical protein